MTRTRVMYIFVFLLGFAAAYLYVKYAGQSEKPLPADRPAPARSLSPEDLAPFFEAVDREDFPAMARLGKELLAPGVRIPGSAEVLKDFAIDSFPPHQVYALFAKLGEKKSYRVLLTMDDNDTVVSFMAEEVPVSR